MNCFNPELQLKDNESAIRNKPINFLTELKAFKFVTTLVLEFNNIGSDDKTKYDTLYSNSKADTVINESNIDNVFESINTTITSSIQKSIGKGSGWNIFKSEIMILIFQSTTLWLVAVIPNYQKN